MYSSVESDGVQHEQEASSTAQYSVALFLSVLLRILSHSVSEYDFRINELVVFSFLLYRKATPPKADNRHPSWLSACLPQRLIRGPADRTHAFKSQVKSGTCWSSPPPPSPLHEAFAMERQWAQISPGGRPTGLVQRNHVRFRLSGHALLLRNTSCDLRMEHTSASRQVSR